MYYVNKTVSSGTLPQLLEVTPTAVYVRKDVVEVTEDTEDKERTYYRYKESKYNKDEYIEQLSKSNNTLERMSITSMLAIAEKDKEIEKLKQTNLTTMLALAELNKKLEGDND